MHVRSPQWSKLHWWGMRRCGGWWSLAHWWGVTRLQHSLRPAPVICTKYRPRVRLIYIYTQQREKSQKLWKENRQMCHDWGAIVCCSIHCCDFPGQAGRSSGEAMFSVYPQSHESHPTAGQVFGLPRVKCWHQQQEGTQHHECLVIRISLQIVLTQNWFYFTFQFQ